MNLNDAVIGQTYTIKEICTDDEDLELFLSVWAVTAENLLRWYHALKAGVLYLSKMADTT